MMCHVDFTWHRHVERAAVPVRGLCLIWGTAPKPLRDEFNLFGLTTLSGRDRLRVLQSNSLFAFTVDLLYFCYIHKVIVSVENPENSWLWAILKELVVAHHDKGFRLWFQQLSPVTFSNCAWGGERPKSTKWLSTPGVYDRLLKDCPGISNSHVRKPYVAIKAGNKILFSTSEEAEYLQPLCVAAVESLATALRYPANMATPSLKLHAMAASHQQHRRYPPLIPFCDHVSCAFGPTPTARQTLKVGGNERERSINPG